MASAPLFFLADDDVDDQMLFLEALMEINSNIRCTIAKNGEEALLILQDRNGQIPDYIFLDLNMPRMSGLKCLLELKKINAISHVPVIIYSTSSQKEYIDESMKLGATHFFVKPSNFRGLMAFIQDLIK